MWYSYRDFADSFYSFLQFGLIIYTWKEIAKYLIIADSFCNESSWNPFDYYDFIKSGA